MAYKFNDTKQPKPETGPRKGQGEMDADELDTIVAAIIRDAQNLADDELTPAREKAAKYYKGDKFGNEQPGRSQIVVTEVRDQILGIKPSLMRIIFGPENVVEFVPRTPQRIPLAKQATDYVNYVFTTDNNGYMKTDAVLNDGLIKKIGIFKYWWEDGRVCAYHDEGLSAQALESIVAQPYVTPTKVMQHKGEDGLEPTFALDYTIAEEGRIRVAAVPPEEFIFNREAREIEGTLFVGHRRTMSKGDLIALGVSEKEIEEHGNEDARLQNNAEELQRRSNQSSNLGDDPDAGEANEDVTYVEGYMTLDFDGDGYAELRKICTIGAGFHVVHNEPAEEAPFAIFTPIPEAHTLIGYSLADLTMDMQLAKSTLLRSIFDSLALAIFPRTAFIEGQASVEDILNTEIGAPIRMRRENAVQSVKHDFTGAAAMPMLEYCDQIVEGRTGRNKGAMALDADALQSSTGSAVTAALTASQERVEGLARIFAEQTLKPLFRGIYKLLVKHQPSARITKLRGSYVAVDVASWDSDMDVIVNVMLGTGTVEQRRAVLEGVATKQETWFTTLGPGNPFVDLPNIRETYTRILDLAGFRDNPFFNEVQPGWAPPQAPPPPTPEHELAQAQLQVEQMRTEKELQIKEAELMLRTREMALKEIEAQRKHELETQKLSADFTLRRYQIETQAKNAADDRETELDTRAAEVVIDHTRAAQDHARSVQQMHMQAAHEANARAEDQAHERDMAAMQASHEMQQQQQAQTAAPEPTE